MNVFLAPVDMSHNVDSHIVPSLEGTDALPLSAWTLRFRSDLGPSGARTVPQLEILFIDSETRKTTSIPVLTLHLACLHLDNVHKVQVSLPH